MIALPNNKIAVVGWVIWAEKYRDFVALIDYETNEEKIIWDYFTDQCEPNGHCSLFNYSYAFDSGGIVSLSTMPYSRQNGISSPPQIACVNNRLVIAYPTNGDISIFDLNGNLIAKDKIEWTTNYLSVEEQTEIQQKAIEHYKSMINEEVPEWIEPQEYKKAINSMVQDMEGDLTQIENPIPIPMFSTMLKDSDDNLLIFEYPKEEGANKFHVWIYGNSGQFIGESTFVCDDYELEINPLKMVFHNGYIYALQKLKKSVGVPLRLVRFKLM